METGEGISVKTLEKIIQAYKERLKKLSEIINLTDFFFKNKLNYDKNLLKWSNMQEQDIKESLLLCDKILTELNDWDIKKIEEVLLFGVGEFNKEKSYPEKNRGFVLWPLRAALSGKQASAGPFEIAEILGKEKTLKRIKEAIALLG